MDARLILRVHQPARAGLHPQPPGPLAHWLDAEALQEFTSSLTLPPSIDVTKLDSLGREVHVTEHLDDHPEIRELFERYEREWSVWAREESEFLPVRDLYSRLFKLERQIRAHSEDMELVLSAGLLSWKGEVGRQPAVYRHVLTIPITIDLDAAQGCIDVKFADDMSEFTLEDDMLEPETQPRDELREKLTKVVADVGQDIWDSQLLQDGLRAWCRAIDPGSTFLPDIARAEPGGAEPLMVFAPAIVLRRRTRHATRRMYEQIASLIEEGRCPQGWLDLVDVVDDGGQHSDTDGPSASEPSDSEPGGTVYFPLPANDEQIRIAQLASSHRGVVVQGPPGTGKSHTIANLVCHLLASGQRVLVMAETSRALSVLKDKIPTEFHPLCVTLLDGGREANDELAAAVTEIASRHSDWSPGAYDAEIARLESDIEKLERKIAECWRKQLELREFEAGHCELEGYSGSPSEIARQLATEASRFRWFEFDSDAISKAEMVEGADVQKWLQVLREAGGNLAKRERKSIPDASMEWKPEVFAERVRIETETRRASSKDDELANDEMLSALTVCDADVHLEFEKRAEEFVSACCQALHPASEWAESMLHEVLGGRIEVVAAFCEEASVIATAAAEAHGRSGSDVKIELPAEVSIDSAREDVVTVMNHLDAGGAWRKFGIATKAVRHREYVRDSAVVDGARPETAEQLGRLAAYLEMKSLIERGCTLWKDRGAEMRRSADSLTIAELSAASDQAQRILTAAKAANRLREFAADRLSGSTSIEFSPPFGARERRIAQAAKRRRQLKESQAEFEAHALFLDQLAANSHVDELVGELAESIRQRDVERYARVYAAMQEETSRRRRFDDALHVQTRIQEIAPELVDAVSGSAEDPVWDARFGEWQAALRWARARAKLKDANREGRAGRKPQSISELRAKISDRTSSLAALKAWDAFLRRLTPAEVQALKSWQAAQKQIGKGTGKSQRVMHARRAARDYMEVCRSAIPAWVMPRYQVAEQTRDVSPGMYDVVIVDEASQLGVESLFVFFIAKRLIIVGDEEQISPTDVGIDEGQVQVLQDRHLGDIDNANLLRSKASLYANAGVRYHKAVVLREHFRCAPEIIEFSNRLCYEPRGHPLIPLKLGGGDRLEPLKPVFVRDGYRQGAGSQAINKPEAEAIVEKIAEVVKLPGYEGKSIGVLSLLSNQQAAYIESRLLERIGVREMKARQVLCGDAYTFQGDERDVMFLSMVAALDGASGLRALTDEPSRQRFNVAASRAREQMWLFHSVQLNDLSPACMRHALLRYMYDPWRPRSADDEKEFESGFERDVCTAIEARGYRVAAQVPAGDQRRSRFRIDLVVEGRSSKLAVECDGDRWHGPEQFESDMARQRQLERAGWRFVRIRGSVYYADPIEAMEPVWQALEQLGIEPHSDIDEEQEQQAVLTSMPAPERPVELSVRTYTARVAEGVSIPRNTPPEDSVQRPLDGALSSSNNLSRPNPIPDVLPPDPRSATRLAIAQAIATLVDCEGRLVVWDAFKLYLGRCSIKRMGGSIERKMIEAMKLAEATNKVRVVDELGTGDELKSVLWPVTPLGERTRGRPGRPIELIPPSEVLEVAGALSDAGLEYGSEPFMRAVLNEFGLTRLTESVREHMETVLTTALLPE